MHKIIEIDKQLFRLINDTWHNGFFDFLMPWLRNAEMWTPLYFFLIVVITVNYKKSGWWWVLFFITTVVITNYISSDIIKAHTHRIRPCFNPDFAGWIRLHVGYLPGNSSFVSSHAANHFAMAMFFYITLTKEFGRLPLLFFIWAGAISYAQMYVGVHYPTDILGGTIIGLLIGYFIGKLFNKQFGLIKPMQLASNNVLSSTFKY